MANLRESKADIVMSFDEICEILSNNKREILQTAFSKTPFTTDYKDFIADRLQKLNNIFHDVKSCHHTRDAFSQYIYFINRQEQGKTFTLPEYRKGKANEIYIERAEQTVEILDEIRKKNLEVFKQVAK